MKPSEASPRREDDPLAETNVVPEPDNGDSQEALPIGLMRSAGTMIGEFKLLKPLGRGGMAEVWLAEQTSLRRNVALKLLRPELTADPTYVKRFQSEAKAAAGLNHPNLVQVFTVGCEAGQHFISQEYVQGQTLKSLLKKRGPLDVSLALHIMRQVAAALEVAGKHGIVHRDIKPENIMLTGKGQVKVADFGLAQLQGGEHLNLTQEGVTMGTPLYMSPEQVSGRKVDQRSDIYSFGVTAYHMLAGRPPFQGENAVQVAVQHLNDAAKPLGDVRRDLPRAVCAVVERMMSKSPDDRYPGATGLLNDLKQLAKAIKTGDLHEVSVGSDVPVQSFLIRRLWLLPVLCVLLAGVAAGIGWAMRPGIPPNDPRTISGDIPRLDSARDQFEHAMLLVNNEDAFRAVVLWHPGDQEKIWHHRTEEQLALLYLSDRRRWDDAERQLFRLESLRPEGERFFAEAKVGQAALKVYRKDPDAARRILQANNSVFEEHLSGTWRRLESEVRERLAESG